MTRPLSFLSDAMLSEMLSAICRMVQRRGCGYHDGISWTGGRLPGVVWMVLGEYKARSQEQRT